MNSNSNRENGKIFEEIFVKQAQFSGLLAIKNHQAAKYTYNGRLQPVEGDLDFKLIDLEGTVGYFDCKSFTGDSFSFSDLKSHQIDRATLLNDWGVPAGFIVCFRDIRRVVFYPGYLISAKGPGNSFKATDGIFLGFYEDFRLRLALVRTKPYPDHKRTK